VAITLKECVELADKENLVFGYPTMIEASDLCPDKVHLNEAGKKKFLESLIGNNSSDEDVEMSQRGTSQSTSDWAAFTPGKMNLRSSTKHSRKQSESDEDQVKVKKPK